MLFVLLGNLLVVLHFARSVARDGAGAWAVRLSFFFFLTSGNETPSFGRRLISAGEGGADSGMEGVGVGESLPAGGGEGDHLTIAARIDHHGR